jgi:HPt (histidine-containing phosphotransfer) domain-containing protein/HAMP domain-containing protein
VPHPLRLKVSIGAKLALSTVFVVTAVTALVASHVIAQTRANLVAAKATAAAMVADQVAVALVAPLDFSDADAVRSELDRLKTNKSLLSAAVWASERTPVAQVGISGEALAGLRGRGAVNLEHRDRLELARPITSPEGKRLGAVAMAFSLRDENLAFARAKRNISWFAASIAAVTALVLVAFSRWQIVRPLDRLVHAARRIGRGDAGVRVELRRADELGRLADVFNGMSEAIRERETRLALAMGSLRELFDHMRQAIVVFAADGKLVGEASREAVTLFAGRAMSGAAVEDVLYASSAGGVEAQAFGQWLELVFGSPAADWSELVEFAPKEAWVERGPGDHRFVRLDFQPIIEGGVIARVMLLATDETAVRLLESKVRSKDEEHARQLAGMRRLIAGGGQVFVTFVQSTSDRIDRCSDLLATSSPLSVADVDEILQHVHTIKGEARSFDLGALGDAAAAFEEELATAQSQARAQGGVTNEPVLNGFRSYLARLKSGLLDAEQLFIAASPIGRAILDQTTVSRAEVQRLNALLGGRHDEVGTIVRKLAARPFGEAVVTLIDRVPSWAAGEGKRARLEVDGREVPVPRELAQVLPGVLTHLVRNSLAHGIEPAETRLESGKPEIALIRAVCAYNADGPIITVEDDGRGVDVDSLLRRARELNVSVEDVYELPFEPRLSTAPQVSDLAGRGMGLSAVRAELQRIGWTIQLDSSRGAGAAFVIRPMPELQTAVAS